MKFTLEETKSGKYSVVRRVNNIDNSFRTSSKLSLFKNMMNTETEEITIWNSCITEDNNRKKIIEQTRQKTQRYNRNFSEIEENFNPQIEIAKGQ